MSCVTAPQTTGTVYEFSLPHVVAITAAAKAQLIQKFAGIHMYGSATGSARNKASCSLGCMLNSYPLSRLNIRYVHDFMPTTCSS